MELAEQAKEKSLIRYVVVDAGKTQVKANSVTVLAIGPGIFSGC